MCSIYLQLVILTFSCIMPEYCAARKCGITKSRKYNVNEDKPNIETYPWMGLLIYPFDEKLSEEPNKATVILVSTVLALSTALEIDKFPKVDFRQRSRVILGRNCSTGPFIRVVEYTYHPEFAYQYYSTLAMVQLESGSNGFMPICGPPKQIASNELYALTLKHDCTSKMIRVYKMQYIDQDYCKFYYRRNGLDVQSLWPKYGSCAQALHGGHCLWRSGTALVVKQGSRWHLLGVGVYGPGCEAPARFLDYDKYVQWLHDSVARIGKVSITRTNNATLILRRTMSNIQRYGPCDVEEMENNFFTDYSEILSNMTNSGTIKYNLTIFGRIEYHCIIITAWYSSKPTTEIGTPELKLRKWCTSTTPLCAETAYSTIFFFVIIKFVGEIQYKISFYGKPIKSVDAKRVLWLTNQQNTRPTMSWPVPWYSIKDSLKLQNLPQPRPTNKEPIPDHFIDLEKFYRPPYRP